MDKPSFYSGWVEPPSAAQTNPDSSPQYPYNNVVIHDESGNIIETDSTPSRERIRLSHRTGTFIEMHPNGDEVHKVYGNNYSITVKDNNVLIQGACNITIEGNANIEVFGDKTEYIHGNYELHVDGSMSQTVKGMGYLLSEQDMVVGGGGLSGGAVTMKTGDHLYFEGDLSIGGEFHAKKITAETRVDAGYGMSAGVGGFCTMSGGIFVGYPAVAPPDPVGALRDTPGLFNMVMVNGPILSISQTGMGFVYASQAAMAPIGLWDISSSSYLHFDTVNNMIFDFHIHPTWNGPTGPPVFPFLGVDIPIKVPML